MDDLNWIQEFFASLCDGEWEKTYGVNIETLDNPGWQVTVDLFETALEDRPFEQIAEQRTETDWLHCSVGDGQFIGAGGPRNLEEILAAFRKWVETYVAEARSLDISDDEDE